MTDGLKRCICLCILETDKDYLLIKRGKSKKDLEDWNDNYIPIGGKIELYETPEDAIIREVEEETGITIETPILLGILTETSPLPKYNNVVYFFNKKIIKQQVNECDEGYLEWIEKANLSNITIPEIDKIIYEYLEKSQKFIMNATYDERLNLLSVYEYLENKSIKNTKY